MCDVFVKSVDVNLSTVVVRWESLLVLKYISPCNKLNCLGVSSRNGDIIPPRYKIHVTAKYIDLP